MCRTQFAEFKFQEAQRRLSASVKFGQIATHWMIQNSKEWYNISKRFQYVYGSKIYMNPMTPPPVVSAACCKVNRYVVCLMLPIGLMDVLLEISQYTVISLNLMCLYSLEGIVFCWDVFWDKPNMSEWDNIMDEYYNIMDKYHKNQILLN